MEEKVGTLRMRMMTDFCAERYWTVVSEMEAPDLHALEQMMSAPQGSAWKGGALRKSPNPSAWLIDR